MCIYHQTHRDNSTFFYKLPLIHLDINMNNKLCHGFGRYHTNNPENPKAQPFSTVTGSEIIKMAANPETLPKQSAPWVIPSVLLSRSKSAQRQSGEYYALVLDIDHNPPVLNKLAEIITLACRGCEFLIYTSRSANQDCQKSHVIVFTTKLTGYRWYLSQMVFNDLIEQTGVTPDRKTEDANQICYLPNRGKYYNFIHHPGTIFNPLKEWYPEMLEKHQGIEAKKQERAIKEASKPIKPNSNRRSLISEFNATFTVEELLIKAGYAQKNTCFKHPNSNTGNYSASVKNGKVFTLSSADPLYSPFAHDAFNVFVILLNEGDRKAAMLNAGDNWLSVNGVSWNKYQQKNYMERR